MPFRTKRRSSAKHSHISYSPESPTRKLQEDKIGPFILKRIEQDIATHKVQNRKDFFVFGLSDNAFKSS